MKTLYEKRILVDEYFAHYPEEDIKEFIKELLEISKENNWEVAIDDGHKDGFKIISGEEWIKNKSGFEE